MIRVNTGKKRPFPHKRWNISFLRDLEEDLEFMR